MTMTITKSQLGWRRFRRGWNVAVVGLARSATNPQSLQYDTLVRDIAQTTSRSVCHRARSHIHHCIELAAVHLSRLN